MTKLLYLTLQATTQGQAAHAHVHEIVEGLGRRGWDVDLRSVQYEGRPSVSRRITEFLRVQLRALRPSLPPVIYMRWHFGSLPLAAYAHFSGRSVVQEVNGNFNDMSEIWPAASWTIPVLKWSMTWQLRRADLVISVTNELSSWVGELAPSSRRAVVTNGADLDLFSPLKAEASLPQDVELPDRYVVFFGALSPWQGVPTMLSAVQSPDWPADVRLVIIGDGAQRDEVVAAAERDEVTYLGRLPYESIGVVVARSMASLICKQGGSAATGVMPLKLFESLGSGVPVIVTDFPGLRDVAAESGAGVVIAPESPEELVTAVRSLAHDPQRSAMGARGRAWVENGHSWDARAGATSDLLTDIVDR